MSLCAFQAPNNPWFPDINNKREYWQFHNSIEWFWRDINTNGDTIIKKYKKYLKESNNPQFVIPPHENYMAYMFFMIGYGSQYTQFCGATDTWGLHKFDEDYRDGGEDDEGGCIWIERNKIWFTPRRAKIFI